jgi:hypothetical protein
MTPKAPPTSSPSFLYFDFGNDVAGHDHQTDKAARHIDAHLFCVAARFCGCAENIVVAGVAMFSCACEDEVSVLVGVVLVLNS